MSILIVEDNPINAKLLQHNLAIGGYDTLWAQNGRQALDFLNENSGIRLVISDIMMPEMDGLEFLGRLKETPQWQDLPVIMCTSLSDLKTVKKAAREGCRSYIVKPIQTDQLMGKVREVLGREKAIIGKRASIMAELGLSTNAFNDILAAFAALIDNTITLLEQQSPTAPFPDPEINLQNLSERANLLGAESVGVILDLLTDGTASGAPQSRPWLLKQLLKELQRLQLTLPHI
jgi:CheY-like chemotaxis protein